MSPFRSRSILVVEDDQDASENLQDILELDGYEVQLVPTVKGALSNRFLADVDVILLDRQLPDGTAENFLPKLRERAPHAAIIIITGYADLQSTIAALRLGAADYLLKPINADELRVSLHRISEQKRMQAAVVERDARLRAIYDSAADAILTFDEGGIIETANPASSVIFQQQDLTGRRISTIIPALESLRTCSHAEMLGQCAGRGDFPIDVTVSQISLGDDRKLFTAFVRDVSELKRAQTQLLQSERLAAIGKAMAGLVHESRNALQRSQAGLERLERRVRESPESLELITAIQRAQDDLHRLYEEVREYAAPVRIRPQSGSLKNCIQVTWSQLRGSGTSTRPQLSIRTSTSSDECEFDAFMMRQVFRNVLENAIAAKPDASEIDLEICDDVLEGKPAVSIFIRDQGPGLTAAEQSRMFEEFYTTKTHGTGLGLPIARRIVQGHHGRITAASLAGSGAQIQITLPRSQT
ncbi:MAG: response regulator [Planctomycetaceae bacterium]